MTQDTFRLPAGENGALRADVGKPRVELIPTEAVWDLAEGLGVGADKYDDWNWAKGLPWTQILASLQRHLLKFREGHDIDEDTGATHLSLALANLAFLSFHARHHRDLDDRTAHYQIADKYREARAAEKSPVPGSGPGDH